MAALIEPVPQPQIVDLRELRPRELDPLLQEETITWERTLDWDFHKSADLVRRFVDLRALNGSALVDYGTVIGYGYYVLEDQKGLIGDIYVRRDVRTPEHESRLLTAMLDHMINAPQISRIESQLMMVDSMAGQDIPGARFLSTFLRNFMVLELAGAELPQGHVRYRVYVEKWMEHFQDSAAAVIAAAYAGHIDSRINDQYRSAAGARRFLYNIVQYPGCGAFYRPASFVALEAFTGQVCGVSLASMVAHECGHITQICVSPAARGTGIGHALLRKSLLTLRDAGCGSASLTVTAANEDAVKLYERVGFETVRRFSAFAWEGF